MTELYVPKKQCFVETRNKIYDIHRFSQNFIYGGKEIEISDSGDAARIRTNYGDGPSKPSEWCEIQYDYQDEDGNDIDDGRPYILVDGEKEYLDNYMRYR